MGAGMAGVLGGVVGNPGSLAAPGIPPGQGALPSAGGGSAGVGPAIGGNTILDWITSTAPTTGSTGTFGSPGSVSAGLGTNPYQYGIGSTYATSAYDTLTNLLNNAPIANLVAGGAMDTLVSGERTAQQQGLKDLAKRGMVTTGATPEMQKNIQQQYLTGAAGVTQEASAAEAARQMQVLNAMLGIGGDVMSSLEALTSGQLAQEKAAAQQQIAQAQGASDLLTGLFARPGTFGPTGYDPTTGQPLTGGGGLLTGTSGGGLGGLLSQAGSSFLDWISQIGGSLTSTPTQTSTGTTP